MILGAARQPLAQIDRIIAHRVTAAREAAGVSAGDMAEALDITLGQYAKLERAINRISIARLAQIARVLDVPMASFFEGLPDDGASIGTEGMI